MAVLVDPQRARAHEPIDWLLAGRIARRVAGKDSLSRSYLAASLASDFAEVSAQAEDLVAEYTGLRAPGPARAQVLDRGGWVEANVRSMRHLLAPLTDRIGARIGTSPLAPVGRTVTATELGVLLGWFSQRVLGQYDLLVPTEDDGAPVDDAVYYVGPNVLALEKRYAFRPRDYTCFSA
ncbi:MAG: zinc-dependent metalloprotease [Actinomycetota bacterium]